MNWHRPILTDSGGFQVFSLADLRSIRKKGRLDPIWMVPNNSFPRKRLWKLKMPLVDIIMALDECIPYPADYDYTRRSVERQPDG